MTSRQLVSLQFAYHDDAYHDNLKHLISLIQQSDEDAIVVAPELCLTNFSFSKMDDAVAFGKEALQKILPLSKNRIICFSLTTQKEGEFYNSAVILHDEKIQHQQDKVKLFSFGQEDEHFDAGNAEKVKIVEIDGLRFATLICFEIRFTHLWDLIRGADIIMIPALWGKHRKSQFESITTAMAIMQQAFVIVADASQEDMARSSGIISPFGEALRADNKEFISLHADLKEIQKMRRYMNIGLS
jgi:predicted amidohydrolase